MGLREAYWIVLKDMLQYLDEEGMYVLPPNASLEEVVKRMYDDYQFIKEFAEFLQDHLETFGENYGL